MFTLQEVKDGIRRFVGTEVASDFFTDDMIKKSASATLREILTRFKPQEYFESDIDISLVEKKAEAPENYMIWIKIFPKGDPNTIIRRVLLDYFDRNITNTWTSRIVGEKEIFLCNTEKSEITLRYIAKHEEFEDFEEQILLPYYCLDGFSEWTAAEILRSAMRDEWKEKKKHAEDILGEAIGLQAEQNLHTDFWQIQSKYSQFDIFQGH